MMMQQIKSQLVDNRQNVRKQLVGAIKGLQQEFSAFWRNLPMLIFRNGWY